MMVLLTSSLLTPTASSLSLCMPQPVPVGEPGDVSLSVVQDDDVLARRGAGFEVGLGVSDLFQAVVDLRDRDVEASCGDGLELVGEGVGREVAGLTAVGGQAYPEGDHERGEVRDGPLARQGSGEADGAVPADGVEGVGEDRAADQFQGGVDAARDQLAHLVGEGAAVDEGMIDARGPQFPGPAGAAGGGDDGGAEVLRDGGRAQPDRGGAAADQQRLPG